MMAEFVRPVVIDDVEIGLSAHEEVAAGGHFFGSQHTLARFETAFYQPMVSDWRNYESWKEAGSIDATQRAHKIWKELLANYEAPPLDAAKKDALAEYVARRKEEIARTGLD
jgi:trimethylamine--corrinoid protein Co-methyltransferase